jgi:hypothetical protein
MVLCDTTQLEELLKFEIESRVYSKSKIMESASRPRMNTRSILK